MKRTKMTRKERIAILTLVREAVARGDRDHAQTLLATLGHDYYRTDRPETTVECN